MYSLEVRARCVGDVMLATHDIKAGYRDFLACANQIISCNPELDFMLHGHVNLLIHAAPLKSCKSVLSFSEWMLAPEPPECRTLGQEPHLKLAVATSSLCGARCKADHMVSFVACHHGSRRMKATRFITNVKDLADLSGPRRDAPITNLGVKIPVVPHCLP